MTAKLKRRLLNRVAKIEELAGEISTGSYMTDTARAIERECRKLAQILETSAPGKKK